MPNRKRFFKVLTNVDTAITTLIITNVISGAALFAVLAHFQGPHLDSAKSKDFSETFKNFMEVVALATAGIWTYYLFIKGRILKERLELKVSGRYMVIEGRQFLITTGKITNVGTSNFTIMDNGAFLRIAAYPPPNETGIHTPKEIAHGTFSIFPKDRLLEPGETISNERITTIDHQFAAIGIEMYIYSSERTWYTSCIVEKSLGIERHERNRNQHQQSHS